MIALAPAGGSLVLALAAFFVYGVGFGGTNAMMFSMQADTVDYGEWKAGTRAEGGTTPSCPSSANVARASAASSLGR